EENDNYIGSSDEEDDDDTEYTYETDIVSKDVQQEWEDNIVQLKTLVNFVIIPIVGKVLGRRFAKAIWSMVADMIF
ncbi:hypothetical protein CANARDRAFT_190752, partial [[Candida] arabinofermentans NRRL YB-2248]